MNPLDLLDDEKKDIVIKAPMNWHGGKSRIASDIVTRLPRLPTFVDVFAGAGNILLAKQPSKIEVFNDRYHGVTDFYRVLHDPVQYQQLIDRLRFTIHSKEEFIFCRDTWEKPIDPVERAARWYYMIRYSFGAHGRNFGRATTSKINLASRFHSSLDDFTEIHRRIRYVQFENLDWEACIDKYDGPDVLFYLDPPYYGTYDAYFGLQFTEQDHIRLIMKAMSCQGAVAISGYPNKLYDSFKWTQRHELYTFSTTQNPEDLGTERSNTIEVLWIKD